MLLVQRAAHLRSHGGQIAFAGGKQDPDDASPIHTALRETQEELGIAPHQMDVLGYLPAHQTRTGFAITPVLALLPKSHQLVLNPDETASAFEVPLEFLMNPRHHQRHRMALGQAHHEWMSITYSLGNDQKFIWGATAHIIISLYHALRAQIIGVIQDA
jgi:8-oxo-dGTP pyrophosphatase MutT (NUDIX family)